MDDMVVEVMKKYIKIIITATLIMNLVFLAGCEEYISTPTIAEEKNDEIIRCFNEKDAEGLKELFCKKVQESDELDQQIKVAFEFIDGEIISYDEKLCTINGGKSVDDGKTTRQTISPHIPDVKTTSSKIYEIQYYLYIINKKFPETEGISEITLISEDGTECAIGDYYLVNPK